MRTPKVPKCRVLSPIPPMAIAAAALTRSEPNAIHRYGPDTSVFMSSVTWMPVYDPAGSLGWFPARVNHVTYVDGNVDGSTRLPKRLTSKRAAPRTSRPRPAPEILLMTTMDVEDRNPSNTFWNPVVEGHYVTRRSGFGRHSCAIRAGSWKTRMASGRLGPPEESLRR